MLSQYAKALLRLIGDFVFPRDCAYCGSKILNDQFSYICNDCKASVFIKNFPRCKKCGEILSEDLNLHRCAKCIDKEFFFSETQIATEYGEIARSLCVGLKYNNSLHLINDMVKLILKIPNIKEFLRDSVIVPVPLGRKRYITRGYNQSYELAKVLAKEINIPCINILKRIKETGKQTNLSQKERAINMRNAFQICRGYEKYLAKRIIIFDDVMTSGVTINECGKILRKNNFQKISALAFARRSL